MTTTTSTTPARRLPGPRRIPLIGWRARALSMLQDPPGHFMELFDRYGELSAWEPAKPKHVFAFGPEQLRALFAQPEMYVADAFREVRMPPGGSFERLSAGLLRLNGPEHRKHRRLMQPPFTPRRVTVHRQAIVELTRAELDSWQVGQTRSFDKDMSRLVMLIAIRTIFNVEAPKEVEQLHDLVTRLLKVAAAPTTLVFPFDLPGTTYRTALRTSEQIEDRLRSMIQGKRSATVRHNDVLSAMISARDDDGATLTDDELISEAYTSFCHESSAAALSWLVFLLDQHRDVLSRLEAELASVLGGADPEVEQLEQLPFLDAVVKESLRLLPPAAFALRYTAAETQLLDYELPARSSIFYSPYVTHRIPDLYPNPLRFDPSRWEGQDRSIYEYLPFGAGAHHCIGKHFALLEIKLIIAMILQRFRPSLQPGAQVDRAVRISLVPKRGMPMILHPLGHDVEVPVVRGDIRESVELPPL